ncbi:MAG: TonB-dependent receptor [Phaeodactylibacter sp.]|nr:TonB-dependent receptor [Phaeodactylibacter sp.]MCB9052439.1 TonB-dependent receptor [Lewinellaceae bacterium]
MSKFFTFFCLLALCFQTAIAQKATIEGKVVDASTGEPLIAATVRSGDIGTITDFDGTYSLELDAGDYSLAIRYVGYQPYNKSIKLEAGQVMKLDAFLEVEAAVLQTATVTSGKFEKPLSEVTVSLEVLRPDLIKSTGKVTIDEALEKIPGVTIIDGQANIRGGSGYSQGAGSRVLLMVDDMPILTADAGYPNWDDVPVENIAQVEVVKGAASALYGSSALNGIINVRTAYPKAKPETEVATWYTSYMNPRDERLKWWDSAPYTFGASAAHRRKIGKLDLVLGGYLVREEDYNKDTYRRFGRTNFSTRYRATDRLTIGLNGNFNFGETAAFLYWASDTMAYIAAPNTLSNRKRTRFNIDPFITYYDKGGNRHRLQGRFYNVDNNNDQDQSNSSDMYYGEYQFQRQITPAELVVTAGAVVSGTAISAELYGDTTYTSRNIATYVQLEKKFMDRLNVSGGFRYENNVLISPAYFNENKQDTITKERESRPVFRIGLNYRVGEASYFRASWGQGYRFPTVAEKFIRTNAGFIRVLPNPSLGSETGWSAELGLKQGFRINGFEGFVDLAGFISRYQDMIEFNFIGQGFKSVNIGGTDIKGFEATIAGRGKLLGIPVSLLTGYTYIDPKFEEFGLDAPEGSQALFNAQSSSEMETNVLKYRSRHLFKFDLEGSHKGFFLGTEIFYNSQLVAIDNLFEVLLAGVRRFREEHSKGYTLLNLRTGYNFSESLKLTLLLNNTANIEYATRPALMEAPRNLTARVDYKF